MKSGAEEPSPRRPTRPQRRARPPSETPPLAPRHNSQSPSPQGGSPTRWPLAAIESHPSPRPRGTRRRLTHARTSEPRRPPTDWTRLGQSAARPRSEAQVHRRGWVTCLVRARVRVLAPGEDPSTASFTGPGPRAFSSWAGASCRPCPLTESRQPALRRRDAEQGNGTRAPCEYPWAVLDSNQRPWD